MLIINFRFKDKQSLWLEQSDIELLKLLYENQFLTQNQLSELYCALNFSQYQRSFRRRADKFKSADLIKQTLIVATNRRLGVRMTKLSLTEKGFWLLQQLGHYRNLEYHDFFEYMRISDSKIASRELLCYLMKLHLTNNGQVTILNTGSSFSKESISNTNSKNEKCIIEACDYPTDLKLFSAFKKPYKLLPTDLRITMNIKSSSKAYVYDYLASVWSAQLGDEKIALEIFDENSQLGLLKEIPVSDENVKTLNEYMIMYANHLKSTSQKVTVLFVFLDNSILFSKSHDCDKKLVSVKTELFDGKNNNLNNLLLSNDNLDFYLLSLEQAKDFFDCKFTSETLFENKVIEDSINSLQHRLPPTTLVNASNAASYGITLNFDTSEISQLLLLKNDDICFVPFFMIGGNMKKHQQIRRLSAFIEEVKLKTGLPIKTYVLVIYPTEENMLLDEIVEEVLSPENILITNLIELSDFTVNKLPIYKNLTREEMKLYE